MRIVFRLVLASLRSRRPQVRILSGAPILQAPFPSENRLLHWFFGLEPYMLPALPVGQKRSETGPKHPIGAPKVSREVSTPPSGNSAR